MAAMYKPTLTVTMMNRINHLGLVYDVKWSSVMAKLVLLHATPKINQKPVMFI